MTCTYYIIDSVHENADGGYERVETTRNTPEGLEFVLDRLNNDPTCVTVGVLERTYDL
jgi:hypothetical protein